MIERLSAVLCLLQLTGDIRFIRIRPLPDTIRTQRG
jgi:hypothetical protein